MSELEGSVRYDDTISGPSGTYGSVKKFKARWRIHFAKAPSNCRVTSDPISYDDLAKVMQFDRETAITLQKLGEYEPDTMRLYITENCGFIYDPVLLESPTSAFIVDWGLPHKNRNVELYIKQRTANLQGLHTFIFTTKRNEWIYLGHHQWALSTAVGSVLRMLKEPAQRTLAGRRSGDKSPAEYMRKLQGNELVQFVIEIKPVHNTSQEDILLRKLQSTVAGGPS